MEAKWKGAVLFWSVSTFSLNKIFGFLFLPLSCWGVSFPKWSPRKVLHPSECCLPWKHCPSKPVMPPPNTCPPNMRSWLTNSLALDISSLFFWPFDSICCDFRTKWNVLGTETFCFKGYVCVLFELAGRGKTGFKQQSNWWLFFFRRRWLSPCRLGCLWIEQGRMCVFLRQWSFWAEKIVTSQSR